MAQDNFPYETAGNVPLPANPVDAFCSYMNQSYDGDDDLIDVRNYTTIYTTLLTFRNTLTFIIFCFAVQALHRGVSMYSNYTGGIDCIDFFQAAGPTTNRFEGAFSFQLCSELAFPFCSRANDPKTMFPPFEWNMTEYSNLCYDKFHVRPDTQMVLTNFGEDRLK